MSEQVFLVIAASACAIVASAAVVAGAVVAYRVDDRLVARAARRLATQPRPLPVPDVLPGRHRPSVLFDWAADPDLNPQPYVDPASLPTQPLAIIEERKPR